MWVALGSAGYLGLEIAIYIGLVGHYGGDWLAGRFGMPWLYWLAMFIGVACAVNALVRVNRRYQKSLQKPDDSPPEHPLA